MEIIRNSQTNWWPAPQTADALVPDVYLRHSNASVLREVLAGLGPSATARFSDEVGCDVTGVVRLLSVSVCR